MTPAPHQADTREQREPAAQRRGGRTLSTPTETPPRDTREQREPAAQRRGGRTLPTPTETPPRDTREQREPAAQRRGGRTLSTPTETPPRDTREQREPAAQRRGGRTLSTPTETPPRDTREQREPAAQRRGGRTRRRGLRPRLRGERAPRERAVRTTGGRAPRTRARAPRKEAMTLIEIMIVIIILALAATGLTLAVGAITRTKLKSACVRVAAAARFSYNRAATSGNTIRIVFDLDEGTIGMEQAEGTVMLSRLDDPRRRSTEDEGGDATAVDPWAAARARLETTIQPTFGASPFSPIANAEGAPLRRYQTQPLGSSVSIVRLITPHEQEPREEGRGAIYFFPGGQTEEAVVQLTDGGDDIYSVEIRPLTGRAIVHNFAFEPEPIRDRFDDREQSEAEDPG